MTDLRNQRRMAASILKCGGTKVWMDPDRLEEIAKAVTRNDVQILINGGAVKSIPKQGNSRGRHNYVLNQRKKGRRTGQGSRKGPKHARLRQDSKIDAHTYRQYYRKAKGGVFRSKQHLKSHLLTDNIIKEEKQ